MVGTEATVNQGASTAFTSWDYNLADETNSGLLHNNIYREVMVSRRPGRGEGQGAGH